MSSEQDPPRLFLSEGESARELKLALGAAKSDLPDGARLEAILAGLPLEPGPPDGGGDGGGSDDGSGGDPGTGSGDAGPAAPTDITSIAPAAAAAASGWTKLAGVLSLGAALAGVTYVATRPPEPAPTAPASTHGVVVEPHAPSSMTAPPPPAPSPPPSASAPASATSAAVSPPPPPPSASAPPRPEIEILKEAREALGSNPARTLALVDEHARSHPKGALGQEREMLRIQALVALGRNDEARALADAFKKRNPSSVYVQRLEGMFP